MPTLDQLIADKIARFESVPQSLFGSVERAEQEMFKDILSKLNQFEVDKAGNIIINSKNQLLIEEIIVSMNDVLFQGEYLQGVQSFANQFPAQLDINKDIFSKSLPNFTDKELFNQVMVAGQRRTIERLAEGAISEQFLIPLRNAMTDSMIVNSGIADLTKLMSDKILGTKEIDGKLLNWTKQAAYDNFAISDREVSRIMGEESGVEYWRFVGGLIEDSRCFCVTRNNKIFSKVQVEYWGTDPNLWDKKGDCKKGGGMIQGTNQSNIWSYLGGYRCQHSLIPVDILIVPQEIIDNKDIFNYIP